MSDCKVVNTPMDSMLSFYEDGGSLYLILVDIGG